MRYSTFEQAAAEASYGMKEIDAQLEQFRAQLEQINSQMKQLQSKRDLLERLSQDLLTLRPEPAPAAVSDQAEASQPEAPGSLRERWATLGPETEYKPSLVRGRG